MAQLSISISLLINLIEMICFIIFFIELYRHKKRHGELNRTYTSEMARIHAGQVRNSMVFIWIRNTHLPLNSYTEYNKWHRAFHILGN